ncbi:sensor histidine kinase [Paenibacillus silviterrae]|uniref:sensor histidine kinase n=1 Tax=Paenibacillus silviterrae TaxID=3242194 RepID=UPI002543B96B|nr:sensor histidine kinase [Paenibacillus chinjuensis]
MPSILVGAISYQMVYESMDEEISKSVKQTILQTGNNIVSLLDRAKELSDIVYINPVVQQVLSEKSPVPLQQYQEHIYKLRNTLVQLTNYQKHFSVKLYYRDQGQYPFHFGVTELLSDTVIQDKPDFKKLDTSINGTFWTLEKNHSAGDGAEIALIREIKSLDTGEYIGLMSVSLKEDTIGDVLDPIQIGDTGFVYIVDEENRILSHHNKKLLLTNLSHQPYITKMFGNKAGKFIERVDGQEYMFVYETIEKTGWKLIGLVKTNELKSKINYIKWATLLVGLLFFGLAIAYSVLMSNRLSKRVTNLIAAMKRVQTGDFDILIKMDKPGDEINELYRQFSVMSLEIKKLIEEIQATNMKKRAAELKALQHQINPHFLYNTLDSINWMAASRYKANDISMMVTSLANLFRLSLNNSKDFISVKKELEQIQAYTAIQKVRFDNAFTIRFEVDPSILSQSIIKLILQPAVENAIIHGFREIDYPGEIIVRGYAEEGKLVLEVVDNGRGCDTVKLNELLASESLPQESDGGYGIRNVNERIKLYHGPFYGVHFVSSEQHQGTIVRILMPFNHIGGSI